MKAQVKRLLQAKGVWFYCPVSNGMGVHGIPDFICCWQGRFLAIETKAPGKRGNVSAMQEYQIEGITAALGLATVIDDVSQLDELFQEHEHA